MPVAGNAMLDRDARAIFDWAWQQHQRRMQLYVGLDPTASDEALMILRACGDAAESLLSGTLGEQTDDTAPTLITLGTLGAPLIERLCTAVAAGAGIVISSPLDRASLRAHLRHFTSVQIPPGDDVLMALFDPVGILPFLTCADAEQRAAFLSGIDKIAIPYRNDDGTRNCHEVVGRPNTIRPSIRPVRFAPEQFAVFERAAEREADFRVADALLHAMPSATAGRPYADLLRQVSANSIAARTLGVSTVSGLIRFNSLCFTANRPIHQIREVHAFLTAPLRMSVDSKLQQLSRAFTDGNYRPRRAGMPS